VSRRKLTEQEVRYRANYDALTGLPNRGLLMERLNHAIQEAELNGKRVAVMFTDLDHFKQINDTLGHEIGDLLLQEVALYLKSCVRSLDTVARQGGDEFVLVLPGVDDEAHARAVAEKILARFAGPIPLMGHKIHVTSSVGIALYPEDGRDIQTLFRNADMAMYRAKESGRNGFRYYEAAMSEAAQSRHQLQCDLRQALERNELFMHYQPIVALPGGRIEGVEALMRWRQPERGLVSPDQFIPLAEEMGLIHEMFRRAMEEVCAQLAQWRRQGLELYATVNISGRQIPDSLPPARLAEVVARHGLRPEDLILEITEGVLIQNIERAQGWLDAVQAMGFRVALDDFGTGFSSLSYLKRLHLDVVKIDKAFVRDMGENDGNQALVQTVITLGHLMGLRVVAEGVETAWDLATLQAMGCDYAQGYYLSKPMPPEEVMAIVKGRASLPDDGTAQRGLAVDWQLTEGA
jgi:diguanylate cyclase (GGDEF)-like protein